MKIEYLVVISSKEPFCKSTKSFNNLIQSYDEISVSNRKISYGKTSFGYDVQHGEIIDDEQRFFHIKLTCSDKAKIETFKLLLKSLRTILSKVSVKPPEVLWDDISSNYCNSAYPVIHEIENLMRKLITKFMLTNIGLGWTKETIPKEVSESIRSKGTSGQNYLHEVDFIQLSNFLFNEYSTANSRKLMEKLKTASNLNDLELSELKELVASSNWERYFSPIIDCESEYLKKRWKRIYEIRCEVAHNRFIGQSEYDELLLLHKEVKEIIEKAISVLDKIHVTDEQKEEVAENVAVTRGTMYEDFLYAWNTLLDVMKNLTVLIASEDDKIKLPHGNNWRNCTNTLTKTGAMPKDFKRQVVDLAAFRTTLVHHTDVIFTESSILDRIFLAQDLVVKVAEAISEFKNNNTIKRPSDSISDNGDEQ